MRRLAEFTRLIVFDRRGCGVSDREGETITPTLEERMDDIVAVLDAVGSSQAVLLAVSEGGNLAALFAATYPERTSGLILYATVARWRRDDDHPWGWKNAEEQRELFEWMRDAWGLRDGVEPAVGLWAASLVGDERSLDWFARWTRQSVSRSAIWSLLWTLSSYDLVEVFPVVRVPTLVLHRVDDALVGVDHSRRIARQVPDAKLVELPGVDHLTFAGDTDAIITEMEHFLVGSRGDRQRQRRLVTVLVAVIVDPAKQLTVLGDTAWRELLAVHQHDVSAHLDRLGGHQAERLDDRVTAVFDGPARAIRCTQGWSAPPAVAVCNCGQVCTAASATSSTARSSARARHPRRSRNIDEWDDRGDVGSSVTSGPRRMCSDRSTCC